MANDTFGPLFIKTVPRNTLLYPIMKHLGSLFSQAIPSSTEGSLGGGGGTKT